MNLKGLLAAGGDLSIAAAPGRLPSRHLPVVFGRPTGVVVVAESARSARSRANSAARAAFAKLCEIVALR